MESSQSADGTVATALSVVTLLIGATTVFAALEAALEQIWDARALVPKGVRGWIRSRLLSFGVILAVGFLLLVSLSISTALAALRKVVAERFSEFVFIAALLDFAISIGLITALIALIYRYMPASDCRGDPSCGARSSRRCSSISAAGRSACISGARPSLPRSALRLVRALLLWLYYSAQIFLLGAEFTACLGGTRELRRPDSVPSARLKERHARRNQVIWVIVVIVVVLAALRTALPSMVKNHVNDKLHALNSYDGQVGDVHLALWRGAYSVRGYQHSQAGRKARDAVLQQ